MMKSMHFNCDMGEGIGNEAQLMPYIQAANIASGGHAGDEDTMNWVMDLATVHKVEIGIHPSFPDRANFGRKKMNISSADLSRALEKQFEIFLNISQPKNIQVQHIKPHGALYHALSEDPELASTFLTCCNKYLPAVKIFGAPDSLFLKLAQAHGFTPVPEGFADRRYTSQGKLVSRDRPDAIIHDAQESFEQVMDMWQRQKVKTIDGTFVNINIGTICIHGDHEHAVENMKWMKKKITEIS